MLIWRLDEQRVRAEPEAVDDIVMRCARLPLALAIAAARAQQVEFPLAVLAAELEHADSRLDTLDAGDPTGRISSVFSWSYLALTPPAARLFRLLGLPLGPDISAAAAASLAGHPPDAVRGLLRELLRANLLVERRPGRYAYHDLLRAYARQLVHEDGSETERQAALHRLLDHYLHTAHTATMRLHAQRTPLRLPPCRRGVTPEAVADQRKATTWFSDEHHVLLAAISQAADAGFDTHAWQLAWTLATYLHGRGQWQDLETTQRIALGAACRSADLFGRATAHSLLGIAYLQTQRPLDAERELWQALTLFDALDDLSGRANVRNTLAQLLELQARYREALEHIQPMIRPLETAGPPAHLAVALNTIGWLHTRLGEHDKALTHLRRALDLFDKIDDRHGYSAACDSLGYTYHQLGQYPTAVAQYQHALALRRELGERFPEANTLQRLGNAHHDAGDIAAARTAWRQALDIFVELDHPEAKNIRRKLGQPDQE
jgi:tetratricopeptide (TPR) repeat protein